MRFTLFTATTFALGSFATNCLTDASALRVANNFRESIANYSEALALRIFTEDFLDYSDGVNELMNGGCPNGPKTLGSPTFSSLAEFIAAQGTQPPIPFEILNVWHNCETVTMRWRSSQPGFVEPAQLVTGIIVLETRYAGKKKEEPFLIKTVYSEFNSGAWLYDLGVFVPKCNDTAS